jgi:hypothetical protein
VETNKRNHKLALLEMELGRDLSHAEAEENGMYNALLVLD